jgi:hypothetical protein
LIVFYFSAMSNVINIAGEVNILLGLIGLVAFAYLLLDKEGDTE